MSAVPIRTMHERVIAAAAQLTLDVGRAGVTMGKLAVVSPG